jgi:glycosyltransferase involved in cell wall biosynthesis
VGEDLMPKISVAIPAYVNDLQGVQHLKELFDSIKMQTFTDYEVVVSDNSPSDLIRELCYEYSVRYEKNLDYIGMSANSNYAMDLCEGEYIKILHCDDFLYKRDALEVIVDTLDNSDNYWLVNGFTHTYDTVNYFDPRIPKYPDHLLVGNNLLGSPSNVTVRNKDLEYFDTNVSTSMDHEWYHRLRMKFGMPTIVENILTVSRQHNNNVTSKLNFDIVIEGDGSVWQFIQSELEYLQEKHSDFFENWEYPND